MKLTWGHRGILGGRANHKMGRTRGLEMEARR